jgi:hypothetical protein
VTQPVRSLPHGAATVVVIALVAHVLTACSRGDAEWKALTVPEGGFSILMHGQPRYMRQTLDTPAGQMEAHLYSSERPHAYFAAGYSDYPLALVVGTSPHELFTGVRDTWVRRLEGRLVSTDDRLTAGKHPGYAFSAEGKAQGADAILDARLYLVDQRLYQIVAITRKHAISQGVVNRYLESFRLIEEARVGAIPIEPAKQ